jgi:CheY-like chemotaxis protein
MELLALNTGPSMARVEQRLQDGYSTAGSPRTGLGAITHLATLWDLYSVPGRGTALLVRMAHRAGTVPSWQQPRHSAAVPLAVDVACVPYPGETVCGDTWMVAQQGERCLVLVADGLGHGRAAADAAHAAAQGTGGAAVGIGLGLPLCQGIIEDHGGTLRCTSQMSQGTTFRVELPVGVIPETPPASNSETALSPVPSSTILLVDDEPAIANALAQLLRCDGHTVDTAANGRLALTKLQERAYDLILSDLRMPELDGPGLYRALKTCYPHLRQRFIFLTGDTLNPDTYALSIQHRVPQLFKPYTAAELRRVIRQVLQAG